MLVFTILCVMPVNAEENNEPIASGMLDETIFWELETNGMLMITGTGKMDDYNVGSYYDESTHSPLKKYCESITQLVIEDGITTIGNGVFWECINLKSVELPEGIEKIGEEAFYYWKDLKKVVMPESIVSIGNNAFKDCSGMLTFECVKDSYAYEYAKKMVFM